MSAPETNTSAAEEGGPCFACHHPVGWRHALAFLRCVDTARQTIARFHLACLGRFRRGEPPYRLRGEDRGWIIVEVWRR